MNGDRIYHLSLASRLLAVAAIAVLAGCTVTYAPRPYYRPAPVVVGPAPVVVAPVAPVADPALQQLVAPIALYPDPILAVVLPASTYPDQVEQASQFAAANPTAPDAFIAAQPWDPSVQALVHYPTVLTYMAGNEQWTASLGSAFATNQTEVYATIQDLRLEAQAHGNLVSSPEMAVVTENGQIIIQPADPNVICIPVYDPYQVYWGLWPIRFGPRYATGVWLINGFDWVGGGIFIGDWHGGWLFDHGWHRDAAWHGYDRSRGWRRDDVRWGAQRRVDPAHYTPARDVAAHPWAKPLPVHPETPIRKNVPAAGPHPGEPAKPAEVRPGGPGRPGEIDKDSK